MFKKGDEYRKSNNLADDMCLKLESLKLSDKPSLNRMSKVDQEIAKKGDLGQGERLVNSKKK
jgi:hypothetical protein